jgi:hypothetical protein
MSLQTRLAKLEVALTPANRGYRFFYSVDDGAHFAETTQPGGHFSYQSALTGADGNWAPGAELITAADLAEIERAGWAAIVITYATLWPGYGPLGSDSTAAEVAEGAEPEPVPTVEMLVRTNNLPPAVVAAPAPVAPAEVPAPNGLERARRELEARLLAEAMAQYG